MLPKPALLSFLRLKHHYGCVFILWRSCLICILLNVKKVSQPDLNFKLHYRMLDKYPIIYSNAENPK